MNTKTDLRIIKTHKALCNSFSDLIEQKKFEDITVNELCDHAMIRRATFYKHFADKYEFFSFFVQQIQKTIVQQYPGEQPDLPVPALDYYLFVFHGAVDFLSNHMRLVNNIIQSSVFPTLLDIFS
ncbi:MAG: TetR family transcriptional regulator, partial [Eubacteriales bacterium]|nr:TetR family transcriptional regulator [Eubacteriales bacterium]